MLDCPLPNMYLSVYDTINQALYFDSYLPVDVFLKNNHE